jgi:molybdopterin converting factor subunit 1
MRVKVIFFARAYEIVGENEIEFEVEEGTDVSSLIVKLKAKYEGLIHLQFRVAVNADYVENDYILHDKDEVVIIPPISGG